MSTTSPGDYNSQGKGLILQETSRDDKRHDCTPEEIEYVKNLLNPEIRSTREAFKKAFDCKDWPSAKLDSRASVLKKSVRIQAALRYYTGKIKEADEVSKINDRQFVMTALRREALGKGGKNSTSTSRIRALELIGKESGMKFDGTLPGEDEREKSVLQVENAIMKLIAAVEAKLDPVAKAIDITSETIPFDVEVTNSGH